MTPLSRNIKLLVCFASASLSIGEAGTLDSDLALQSANEGLGIAHYAGHSALEVLSVDGKATITTLAVPGLDGLYDVQPSTQVLLGSSKGLLNALGRGGGSALGTASMALFTLDGRQLKSVVDINEGSSTPNYYPESFSWSPDEQFLVYSLKGQVYFFDTSNGTRRSIAEGADPCWSPDGTSIAYRSKNQDLMIYKMATGASERITKYYDVVGFPKWSPDSRYILFTEFSPWLAIRNPLTMPTTDFVVMRVSDRATATVFTPGMGLNNDRFG